MIKMHGKSSDRSSKQWCRNPSIVPQKAEKRFNGKKCALSCFFWVEYTPVKIRHETSTILDGIYPERWVDFTAKLCLTEATLNSKAAVVSGQRLSEISAAPLLAMLAAPTMAAAVELSSRRDGCMVCLFMWVFPKIGGTPKSSIWIGFSTINHPFWGTTIFGNIHVFTIICLTCIPYTVYSSK